MSPTCPSFPRSPKKLPSFNYPSIVREIICSTAFSLPKWTCRYTETILLKTVNSAGCQSHFSALIDISAAFDTIDCSILLSRLYHILGILAVRCLGFSHTSLIEFLSSLSTVFPPLRTLTLTSVSPRDQCLARFSLLFTLIPFLRLHPITLCYITSSLMTIKRTSLATCLNFLKSFIQLSLVFPM